MIAVGAANFDPLLGCEGFVVICGNTRLKEDKIIKLNSNGAHVKVQSLKFLISP